MLKVLFAAAEATPIAKVGGLGDVAGALPKALKSLGVDVRIIIPSYRNLDHPSKLPGSEVPVYYVTSGKYFDRDQIYGYEDDPERFAYFSKGLLEQTKQEGFEPDIIHLNDYHTSLSTVLLKTKYARDPFFAPTKTILTIHNLVNQGVSGPSVLATVGLTGQSTPNLRWDLQNGDIDLLMQGIKEADVVSTVSPTYAKEILTPEYGAGLEDSLRDRQDQVVGILNGIDTINYDPTTDHYLVSNYSVDDVVKRLANKDLLTSELKWPHPDWPIFGMVVRLVEQKGLDLLLDILPDLAKLPLNLVILGLGEPRYETALKDLATDRNNIRVWLEFNEAKARQIYAGSDFFLVPSRYEPSGLTQMIAMRYGSIPVVRQTGGLADTVIDDQNGLVFTNYRSTELLQTIKRALELFRDPNEIARLQTSGMEQDFSWTRSAKEYVKLYQQTLKLPRKIV